MDRSKAPAYTTGASLPSERAFVVQFAAGSTEAGRAEHVVSGRDVRFRSPRELRLFMLRVLEDQEAVRRKYGRQSR
jgi:hypothetical protein